MLFSDYVVSAVLISPTPVLPSTYLAELQPWSVQYSYFSSRKKTKIPILQIHIFIRLTNTSYATAIGLVLRPDTVVKKTQLLPSCHRANILLDVQVQGFFCLTT